MADKLIVGCGYLGRRVAARWLGQGHRVYGTTRSESRAEELRRLGVEPVLCDVTNGDHLTSIPVVGSVLYCVGFDRSAGKSMAAVYVQGLENVLKRLGTLRGDDGALTYVSSTGVYGQCSEEEVDESAATVPTEESGRIVLEAEELIRKHSACTSARTRFLRFAGIYGPGRVIRRQTIEAGEPLVGDPDKWLNLIHVEDGVSAVLAAEASVQPGGVYNVCDDRPVRRRDFYTRMAQLLGAPEPRFVLPEPGAPLPPHERANRRIVNRKMREELGVQLRYPSYEEGLVDAVSGSKFG